MTVQTLIDELRDGIEQGRWSGEAVVFIDLGYLNQSDGQINEVNGVEESEDDPMNEVYLTNTTNQNG